MSQISRSVSIACLAAAVSWPAIVMAQQAATDASTTGPATGIEQTGQPPSTASESFGDIVVTAQRRDQRLTDVPISVTAATGAELTNAGVTTTRDLQLVTPGLVLQSTGPWLQPAIRGVASSSTIPGSEQNVALYVDGVYQPQAAGNSFELPDVERVEVLKGPQGTLFGRNATGGAIQIITREPSFVPTGLLSASYGSFHDTEVKAFVSAPLVDDKIAISLAGSHYGTQGWNHNLLDSGDSYGRIDSDIIRGKVLVKFSDRVKFLFTAFYQKRFDDSVSADSLYRGNGTAKLLGITPLPDQPYEVAPSFPSHIQNENYGFSAKGDIDVDIGTITSTTSYLKNNFHLQTDGDASPAFILQYDFEQPTESYSQELLFSSRKFGRLSFVAGVFYFHLESGYEPGLAIFTGLPPTFTTGKLLVNEQWKTSSTSYAGFGEATYELTDRLTLVGGVRYTYERRGIDNNYVNAPDIESRSNSNVIPRASIQYKIVPGGNLYFTYSQGFKSGLWNSDGFSKPTFVNPEKIKSYEGGFKISRHSFTASAAGFYLDYTNLQNQILDPNTGAGDLQNAGAAHIYGAEAALKLQVTPEFSLTAQGAYTHAEYSDYKGAQLTIPLTNAQGVPIGGNQTVFADLTGTTPARSPRFTGNIALNYEKSLPGGTLDLTTELYYSTHYTIANGVSITQPNYAQLGATASWTIGQSGFKVGVYGKNLTDRAVFLSNSSLPTGDLVSYQEPRNAGVRVQYTF